MSDRIAILNHGDIVQYSAPEELYLDPSNEIAAAFLGESNLLHGSLAEGATELKTPIAGSIRVPCGSQTGEVAVLVRPWSIELAPGHDTPDDGERSLVRGAVSGLVYAGDSEKVLVAVPGHDGEFIIRRLIDNRIALSPGDAVTLRWHPSTTPVLSGSGGAA